MLLLINSIKKNRTSTSSPQLGLLTPAMDKKYVYISLYIFILLYIILICQHKHMEATCLWVSPFLITVDFAFMPLIL